MCGLLSDEDSYTVNRRARTTGQVRKSVAAFIAAGISGINECGADRLTVSQLTESAGATRPTFYSYFGNVAGLIAELWLARGEEFCSRILDPTFRLDIETPAVKAEMRALLEIFTVSRRFPEAAEIVTPWVQKWWEESDSDNAYVRLQNAWRVANRIGMWLTEPAEPRVLSASVLEAVLPLLGSSPSGVPAHPEFAATPVISSPTLADDSMEGKLLDAAIRVISGSGVNAATMSRIARNAHVTTGTIYPRFNSTELLLQSFERAVGVVTEQNFSLITPDGFSPDQFGAIVRAGLSPARKTWRDFRIEIYLEARYNNNLASHLRDALAVTNTRVSDGLGQLPIGKGEREAIAYLVHTIGIGMAVLFNNGIPVDQMDHALITRELVAALARR